MAAKAKGTPAAKAQAPISLEDFMATAQPVVVSFGGGTQLLLANPKRFSTGSFGWFAGDKAIFKVGEKPVRVQVGLNITVVGSKPQS